MFIDPPIYLYFWEVDTKWLCQKAPIFSLRDIFDFEFHLSTIFLNSESIKVDLINFLLSVCFITILFLSS